MLKKLKSELFARQAQKTFINSKVDNSHELIHPKSLLKIVAFINLPKEKRTSQSGQKYVNSVNKTLMTKLS